MWRDGGFGYCGRSHLRTALKSNLDAKASAGLISSLWGLTIVRTRPGLSHARVVHCVLSSVVQLALAMLGLSRTEARWTYYALCMVCMET